MLTNGIFSEEDKQFRDACQKAGIPATARQASKFQNQKGLAYKLSAGKIKVLKDKEGIFIKIINQI